MPISVNLCKDYLSHANATCAVKKKKNAAWYTLVAVLKGLVCNNAGCLLYNHSVKAKSPNNPDDITYLFLF